MEQVDLTAFGFKNITLSSGLVRSQIPPFTVCQRLNHIKVTTAACLGLSSGDVQYVQRPRRVNKCKATTQKPETTEVTTQKQKSQCNNKNLESPQYVEISC